MKLQQTISSYRMLLLILALVVISILLPVGATLARSGGGYHITPVTTAQQGGVSFGGSYTLAWIGTELSTNRSGGQGYRLASLIPTDTGSDYCAYLPIILKNYYP